MVIGNTICLFESLIDALSYFDIYKNFIEGGLVSTNGKMMMTKVINFAIKNNILNIYTCFDNDKKGDEFHNYLKDEVIKKN
jgi:Toprim-like